MRWHLDIPVQPVVTLASSTIRTAADHAASANVDHAGEATLSSNVTLRHKATAPLGTLLKMVSW